jgi:orotidine-5'-phosphate decarboxylase
MGPVDKYNARAGTVDSLLCVGLDPDVQKIPEKFKNLEHPQFEFNKWIIDETHEYVAAFKPNIAFYEERDEAGIKELKMTIEYLRAEFPDIFTIVDIKRGDIGNTNEAYARTYYDHFGFDAVTMHPYMGREPLKYFLDRKDKVCIVLVRTSNPGAGEFQDLLIGGKPLWEVVAEKVRDEWNYNDNCMLVIGAPYPAELKRAREIMGEMTFLIPGVGAQQGEAKEVVQAGLNKKKKGIIVNASRKILFSENPAQEAKKLRDEINAYR